MILDLEIWRKILIHERVLPARLFYLNPFEVAYFADCSADQLVAYFQKTLNLTPKLKEVVDEYYDFDDGYLKNHDSSMRTRLYSPKSDQFYFDIITTHWTGKKVELTGFADTPLREHFVVVQNFQIISGIPKMQFKKKFDHENYSKILRLKKKRVCFEINGFEFQKNTINALEQIKSIMPESTDPIEVNDIGLRVLIDYFDKPITENYKTVVEIEFDKRRAKEALKIIQRFNLDFKGKIFPKLHNKIIYQS